MSPRKKTEKKQDDSQAEAQPKPKRSSARARGKDAPAEVKADAVGSAPAGTDPTITGAGASEAGDDGIGQAADSAPWGRVVVFSLGGQLYAFPIECVQEIQQLVAFTDCPDPVPALVGMVNLRGLVVPLVDLRLLLSMEPAAYTLETPMIICHVHGQTVAVAVDEVEDVVEMPAACMQEPPRLHALGEKMLGVCRMEPDLVFLLDPEAVLPRSGALSGGAAR